MIRPHRDDERGITTWLLSREGNPAGMRVAKMLLTRPAHPAVRVHPGRDWFTVLSGTVVLRLAERTVLLGPARD